MRRGDASDVERHVQGAEGTDRRVDACSKVGLTGHVRHVAHKGFAVLGEACQPLLLNVHAYDPRTGLQ